VTGTASEAGMDDCSQDGSFEAPKRDLRSDIEVSVRTVRRRTFTTAEKLAIVKETLAPGAVTLSVARRHDISSALLYTWRKQLLAQAAGFASVEVVPAEASASPASPKPESTGVIEICLANGATVRVDSAVNARALEIVLGALSAR
jgi:transposase